MATKHYKVWITISLHDFPTCVVLPIGGGFLSGGVDGNGMAQQVWGGARQGGLGR